MSQDARTQFDILEDPQRGLHAVLTRHGLASRTDFQPLVTSLIRWAADACRSSALPPPQTAPADRPAPLGQHEMDWKTAALCLGELTRPVGPSGYYDFSPAEWLDWAKATYAAEAERRSPPEAADEEMTPHTFRPIDSNGPRTLQVIWCKDCEYHRDHPIHAGAPVSASLAPPTEEL